MNFSYIYVTFDLCPNYKELFHSKMRYLVLINLIIYNFCVLNLTENNTTGTIISNKTNTNQK